MFIDSGDQEGDHMIVTGEDGHLKFIDDRPEPKPKLYGTPERCCLCSKGFTPDYVPSRKNIHYVFRVRTKYATYYGETHNGCVDRLRDIQLPGVATEAF